VLLLPAFFNHVVQSTLQVLLFACYLAFTATLLVLFRFACAAPLRMPSPGLPRCPPPAPAHPT
jgi:hypothetical protein